MTKSSRCPRMQCCKINTRVIITVPASIRSSHHGTCTLLALFQISFLISIAYGLTSFPLDTLDFYVLFSFTVPPSESLYNHSLNFLAIDGPLATAYSDSRVCSGEMELGEIYLCWCMFCRGRFSHKGESKGTIAEVKTMGG